MDYQKLGFLAIDNRDFQEAANIFGRALEKEKSSESFAGLGIANYHLDDLATARWAFYKALDIEPGHGKAAEYIALIEKNKAEKPGPAKQSFFRVSDNYLEVYDQKWRKVFIKGINIGLGIPGYFPGEYPIKKGTYLKLFELTTQLGFNSIRTYTVHPPSFFKALYEFNRSGTRLYLFQGIWTELPEDNDFKGERYASYVQENIKTAVDCVYGNTVLPERPGYPHGSYDYDTSPYTFAFVFGREWESCSVKKFNESHRETFRQYNGNFLTIDNGTPFEAWITEMCDFLQEYEHKKYAVSRPVSAINWPTLDPLRHPSESDYEDELLLQGIKVRSDICNESEDRESLDVKKIHSKNGAGFFSTYHVYPYYPDFMNNDYLDEKNTYRAYLNALKEHHAGQPVLVAEFGVPSSREVTHWHRDGWNHGGHSETSQGEINGILMQSISDAGLAGGMLFSLFDEWFKRNWMFLPYEIPAERNPVWFNFQDAEQNYGLLALYPGYPQKKVALRNDKGEWENATALYAKSRGSAVFQFYDGYDKTRELTRLAAQHDEGFLYLLLETKAEVDFNNAHYFIGLDTSSSGTGEYLFPMNTKLLSPIGLTFLIHLAGKDKSRILTCQSYDKYLNVQKKEIKPVISDQAEWVIMQNKSNNRRISKDGTRFFPPRVFSMSNLRFGSLDNKNPDHTSLADFFFSGNSIEMRIPWGLINFTDPSSKTVLWMDKAGRTRRTEGVRVLAVSYKPEEGRLYAKSTGLKNNITDCLPERLHPENIKTYSWPDWEVPIYHTYLKESCSLFKNILSRIPEER